MSSLLKLEPQTVLIPESDAEVVPVDEAAEASRGVGQMVAGSGRE